MDIGALINTLIDALLFLPTWVVEKWGVFGFFLMPIILALELLPVVLPVWLLLRKGAPEKTDWTYYEEYEELPSENAAFTDEYNDMIVNPEYSWFIGNIHYHND
jgi:hypothetical protein